MGIGPSSRTSTSIVPKIKVASKAACLCSCGLYKNCTCPARPMAICRYDPRHRYLRYTQAPGAAPRPGPFNAPGRGGPGVGAVGAPSCAAFLVLRTGGASCDGPGPAAGDYRYMPACSPAPASTPIAIPALALQTITIAAPVSVTAPASVS